ncbi:Prepilin-type N-terminal cleavage/methylation domain-containing protein [Acanthopleuribacter pedis]|uniref:Prepilin-type N-terminal cleavage/methylation domain-containing protein n=2 Tax=Acanthopleuribacter pedis TaxID=442870 RepID=A0A8J7U3E7_9BACT|nr:prepilin-type N-terminal cleavage/methylation domain-containing protein [Acanthopleuribacter pedis]
MKRKGFSLVELMVVVAIIAILTAIALPMYSTFRRRATAQNAIGPCNDARKAIMEHFQQHETFLNFAFEGGAASGVGQLIARNPSLNVDTPIGTGLPSARGVTWTLSATDLTAGDDNIWRATIEFAFTTEVCAGCDGQYCILCDAGAGACAFEIDVDDTHDDANNPLNSLDKNRDTACDVANMAAVDAILNP